ncbi:MAG: phospho-sugar mutase [Eubacteriaceae bacterium]|nr:phospho-sugar mutase [Eubacteriaceae bacterium]
MNREQIIKKAEKEYDRWLDATAGDNQIQKELKALANDRESLIDAFYSDLSFGTSGMRGILGPGTNRINEYVVRRATQGIANYLNKTETSPKVVIAYDSRRKSYELAWETARVLSGNGIKVFITKELAPVPFLSYAVKELNCNMGIMITASHNPKNFNGYKVYNRDGYQIVGDVPKNILKEINSLDFFREIAADDRLIEYVPEETHQDFLETNASVSFASGNSIIQDGLKKLSVVYTPLNGAGNKYVREVLRRIGFDNLHIVENQEEPDDEFPTCPFPNPERLDAFDQAYRVLDRVGADIIIATDPDCDRLGISLYDNGERVLLTGSQTGILMMDFLCNVKEIKGNPMMIKSIATAPLAEKIAEKHHIRTKNTLSGFKYVGEIITDLSKNNKLDEFFFAFEESNGYLPVPYIADKDGVSASLAAVEMAAYYKSQGKTLIQRLNEIYEEYGNSIDKTVDYYFEGPFGKEIMDRIMSYFRTEIRDTLGECRISSKTDYLGDTGLPKSNVLQLDLEDESRILIRPSGTEAKLKVYYFMRQQTDMPEDTVNSIIEHFKNA